MINLKYVSLVSLVWAMAMAVAGIGIVSAADIRIGFTPPVTGASAAEGALQLKAIKLAHKQINAAGGVNGKKVDLVVVDNQSTNPGALAALQKAVEQEKVLSRVRKCWPCPTPLRIMVFLR